MKDDGKGGSMPANGYAGNGGPRTQIVTGGTLGGDDWWTMAQLLAGPPDL